MEESFIDRRKVVVVGTGQVGSDFAYALMISGLANSIVLIDQNPAVAEGHAMDLNHGLSFVQPSGETRLDLVRKNAALFKDLIPKIVWMTRSLRSCGLLPRCSVE